MGASETRRELHHRRDDSLDVAMYYHGAAADPQVTIEVIDFESGTVSTIVPPLDSAMDAFLHPFSYPARTMDVLVASAT